ncbi:hypothetical protein Barb4_03121 [Bacteroidales bacterium Barb4]|nr:hypothetical protein Barb4_03121 [Bacteroidales bacterium Barb4]
MDFSPTCSEAECGVTGRCRNATYNIRSFFQNLLVFALLTPHSAALHVGLKSIALSGHLPIVNR